MAPSHILKTTQGADSQSASDSRRRDAKLKCTKFLKRRKTIIKKADLLHKDCRAKVYIYVELDHKSWVYDSAPTDTSFPPSKSDQLRLYPMPKLYAPQNVHHYSHKPPIYEGVF